MVKSVLGVYHAGLRDWLLQRVTPLVMIVYTFGLLGFFMTHPGLAYFEWHGLMSHWWMKAATLLCVLSLLSHTWVGVWTIFTDYVKCAWIRLVLNIVVMLGLIFLFFQTLLILWSV